MQGQELIEAYLKATGVIKDCLISKIKKEFSLSNNEIESQFIDDIVINQIDGMLINMIENSPHSLFEMFDDNGIYISIIVRRNKDGVLFNYRIVPRDKNNSSRSSKDRKTIEYYAIEDAFETLNNTL